MNIEFGVDLRIREANDITSKILLKRGFKIFGEMKNKKDKPWIHFRDNFPKGEWNIGITTTTFIRDKNSKIIYLKDIPIGKTPQIVNHYYDIAVITEKVSLTETLRNRVPGYEKFYPETFILKPGDVSDLEKLFLIFKNINDDFKSSDEKEDDSLWIVKPSNLRCGQEIYLKKLTDSDILDGVYDFIKTKNDTIDSYVIQKYISKPLLYQGRKFDVRVHVLIDSNYNIYMNPLSFVRTTSRPYTTKLTGDWDIDKYVHLTNHSVQKYDTDFGKYEDHNVLILENVEIEGVNLFERFMPIWRDIIKNILENSKELIYIPPKDSRSLYEFLGFDFIIDENFNTWLLEININPMLNWDNKEADSRMVKLIDDSFKIVIDPKFKNSKKLGKFKNSEELNSWIQI